MSLLRSLILVGLPGAGKSSVGRLVANRLGVGFVDFDLALSAQTGRSVAQLFAEQGEAAFRKLEYQLTADLIDRAPSVWAPGGGWVGVTGVLALVRRRACMIHLKVSTTEALARLRQDASIRPLLVGDEPGVVLDRLWSAREALYAQADWMVDTEGVTIEQVVDRVCELALDERHTME